MGNLVFKIFIFILLIFLFDGCSSKLGIGYNQSYCEEHGCDYQDSGICGDPLDIYNNRKYIDATNVAYKNKKDDQ